MKINITLCTQNLDMSFEARMKRAEALGFDTTKVWYHGSLKHFDSFDARRSGTGGFNFSIEKGFAKDYAGTKSMDMELDADIIVRGFLLPKKLFDWRNKNHIAKLKKILPEKLSIQGRYGWAAWGGSVEYSKEQIMNAIQCIGWSYIGVEKKERERIRNGATRFIKEGSTEVVVNYDKNIDTVEYASLHSMNSIISTQSKIRLLTKMKEDGTGDSNISFLIFQANKELEKAQAQLRTYKLKLTEILEYDHENWQYMESPELKTYFVKLGFEGVLMTERKKLNCTIFRSNRIRSVNAAFDLKKRTSSNIMA